MNKSSRHNFAIILGTALWTYSSNLKNPFEFGPRPSSRLTGLKIFQYEKNDHKFQDFQGQTQNYNQGS